MRHRFAGRIVVAEIQDFLQGTTARLPGTDKYIKVENAPKKVGLEVLVRFPIDTPEKQLAKAYFISTKVPRFFTSPEYGSYVLVGRLPNKLYSSARIPSWRDFQEHFRPGDDIDVAFYYP